jgi:hypothetical protein
VGLWFGGLNTLNRCFRDSHGACMVAAAPNPLARSGPASMVADERPIRCAEGVPGSMDSVVIAPNARGEAARTRSGKG